MASRDNSGGEADDIVPTSLVDANGGDDATESDGEALGDLAHHADALGSKYRRGIGGAVHAEGGGHESHCQNMPGRTHCSI